MTVGIDILEISRFDDLSKNIKKLSKIFTENEIDYFKKCKFASRHIAGTFCAKEACVKALKRGFSVNLRPIDIEILHSENGAPYVRFSKNALKFLNKNALVDISISHNRTQATAICIIS